MTLVIDASVACKWFFDEPGSDVARDVLARHEVLIAPDLILAEVADAALRRLIRSEISLEQARAAVVGVGLIDERVPLLDLGDAAICIADALRHPAYDCFYVALADLRDAPLITDDVRLARAVQNTRWQHRIERLR